VGGGQEIELNETELELMNITLEDPTGEEFPE